MWTSINCEPQHCFTKTSILWVNRAKIALHRKFIYLKCYTYGVQSTLQKQQAYNHYRNNFVWNKSNYTLWGKKNPRFTQIESRFFTRLKKRSRFVFLIKLYTQSIKMSQYFWECNRSRELNLSSRFTKKML